MKIEINKKSIAGYVMAVAGFIIIIIAALNYLFGWEMGIQPTAIGIVFLAAGMAWVKKSRK